MSNTIAAMLMTAVMITPKTFDVREFTRSPKIFLLLEMNSIKMSSGGAMTPFNIAV